MSDGNSYRALAIFRVVTGLWLLWTILPNLDRSFIESLPLTLEQFAQSNPYPPIRWGLHTLAIPNAESLGAILSVGQLVVGGALVIGFLSRLAALCGMVAAIAVFLTAGHLGFYIQGYFLLLCLTFLTLNLGAAGRYWGIDGFLHQTVESAFAGKAKPKFKDKKQKQAVDALNKQLKKSASTKKKPVTSRHHS